MEMVAGLDTTLGHKKCNKFVNLFNLQFNFLIKFYYVYLYRKDDAEQLSSNCGVGCFADVEFFIEPTANFTGG
jgi:hypothetical protein